MQSDFLRVKPGDPVTAEIWNQMAAAARASKLCLGGDNVNVRQTTQGSLINSRFVRGWNHPWKMNSSYKVAQFLPGTINGITPTVDTGRDGDIKLTNNPAPSLAISTSEWDDEGFAWMVLELTFDEHWREIKKAEVRQRPNVTRQDKQHLDTPQLYLGYAGFNDTHTARYPLVRMQRTRTVAQGGLAFRYWQVAMFNLQHKATPPIQEQTSVSRHYFWPA